MLTCSRIWKLTEILHRLKSYQVDNQELYQKNKVSHKRQLWGQDIGQNVSKLKVKHPLTGNKNSLNDIIIDLNDTRKWTREQIADWLDTLDSQPTFYPAIANTSITDKERTYFVREMKYGPLTTVIRYACGCSMTTQARRITCGLCWENRYEYPFGFNGDGFVHDCRTHQD